MAKTTATVNVNVEGLDAVRNKLADLSAALRLAKAALDHGPMLCRYHGGDFGFLGFSRGEPRCESCRHPYRVRAALDAIAALADGAPGEDSQT